MRVRNWESLNGSYFWDCERWSRTTRTLLRQQYKWGSQEKRFKSGAVFVTKGVIDGVKEGSKDVLQGPIREMKELGGKKEERKKDYFIPPGIKVIV